MSALERNLPHLADLRLKEENAAPWLCAIQAEKEPLATIC